MLKEVLSDYPELYEEGWEPDHYAREDLVMTEYRQAIIGTSTSFIVDWNSGHKQTSDFFMYYSIPKEGRHVSDRDIDEPELPSLEMLQNTRSPPPDYCTEMGDCYLRLGIAYRLYRYRYRYRFHRLYRYNRYADLEIPI